MFAHMRLNHFKTFVLAGKSSKTLVAINSSLKKEAALLTRKVEKDYTFRIIGREQN